MRDSNPPDFDASEITSDPSTGRYHLAVDPEQTSRPSLTLVHFIAHVTDNHPQAIPPLQSAIDTDSLDRWLATTDDHQSDVELTFTYAGCKIALDTVGNLWAQPTNVTEENADEPHSN